MRFLLLKHKLIHNSFNYKINYPPNLLNLFIFMKTSININYQSRDNFQTCQVEQKQLKKNYSFNIHTQKNTHQEKKNIFSPLNNKYNHFIENLEAKNSNFNQTSPKDKTRIIPSSNIIFFFINNQI